MERRQLPNKDMLRAINLLQPGRRQTEVAADNFKLHEVL